ncbi:MAG: hypothetical protein HYX20_00925 [Candidatus Yanofskybacteria bacterium]|nr:hypothetical protein [Candidatus Yanofskybacteria bacterium]
MTTTLEKLGKKSIQESKEYLNLKKEISESVRDVIEGHGEEDIEPLLKLTREQLKNLEPDEVMREKLFWEIAAESLKENVFEELHGKIFDIIASGNYEGAKSAINKELGELVKKLSPTIFKNQSRRGFALTVLKNKFLSYLPEIDAIIRGEAESKQPKTKMPMHQFAEQETKESEESIEDVIKHWDEEWDRERPSKNPRFVKEKTWLTPTLEDIVPGLIIEIENIEFNKKEILEIIGTPYPSPNTDLADDLFIRVRSLPQGIEAERSLADMGIIPYETGKYNGWIRPVRWYPK